MKIFKLVTLFIMLAFITGCASRYKKVEPSKISYNSPDANAGVTLEYRYDVLQKKYKKKESKKKLRVIAVKLTNKSGRELTVGQNIRLAYLNGNELAILENKELYKELKQHPATYLLYLLLSPVQFYSSTTTSNSYSNQSSNGVPIGLVIGPGLTMGNLLTASGANHKFKKELEENFINGKVIKEGETLYGIVGIRADTYEPLKIKIQ